MARVNRARVAAAVFSLAVVGAVGSPVARNPVDDGFPLSTYPMFAFARPTLQTIDYAIGETAAGARRTLTPALVGTTEVLQARAVIDHAVRVGRRELVPLCQQIAANVAADARETDVVRIRIVSGTHDAVGYLVRQEVGSEVERTRCEVPR